MTSRQQLVLASGNRSKLQELGNLLADFDFELLPQSAFAVEDAEETGLSFVENAILKARHASRMTGLPALADDSGIEVDALQGRPGIYSARFAGPAASDAENNARLLTELEGLPEHARTARYHCILALMRHPEDPTPILCQGSWEGHILTGPRGQGGFGYDPLFWVSSLQRSAAELSAEEKSRLSHRARASKALRTALAHANIIAR